jgi:protein gp37
MAAKSSIEWTDATWNPVRGCTKVSPGCKHCYAEVFAERFRGVPLGNHLKTGHTLSVQNRPMGLAEDVIVLPCRSVHLQGAIRDVAVMACFQAFLMHVMVVVAPPGSRLAE